MKMHYFIKELGWKVLFSIVVMLFLIYLKYLAPFNIPLYLEALLAGTAYLLIAHKVIKDAFWTLMKRHRMSEQFLMTLATFGAFMLKDFPEALAVMVFYRVGQAFEEYARGEAHHNISSILNLKPKNVHVLNDENIMRDVLPKQVKIGDIIRVLKGESVPLDGVLLDDCAAIDTSVLTGESEPRSYFKDQVVPSGCINFGEVITLKVTTTYKNSSIMRLLNLIEDAAANKSVPETLIRRFAIFYTPCVVTCAFVLALVPLFFRDALFSDWLTRALVFLVISCPCALVLSVPLSFFGGMGALSKLGVIVKGSVHIETLAKLKEIAFDKTGTLTIGSFKVTRIVSLLDFVSENEILRYAAALEHNSTHPVAISIVNAALERGLHPDVATMVCEHSGLGLSGIVDEVKVKVGSARFINIEDHLTNNNTNNETINRIYVSVNERYAGYIEVCDALKPSASEALENIRSMGISRVLISGDRKEVAKIVQEILPLDKVYAEVNPLEKKEILQKEREHKSPVAFCGDGINDALVLSSADVGIAMGDIGSATAIEAADVILLNGSLITLAKALLIARRTYNLAMSNLVMVMLIKVLILIMGALGIANIWLAIFGDVGVLILSVINAMRSLHFYK